MRRGSDELNAPVAVGRAVRAAATVDRAGVSWRSGLVAAIPVAGLLALGNAVGQPIGAVTVAVGAMLVGVAWRAGGPLAPPVSTMAAAAVGLAGATLIGTASGRWPWLHLGILVVLCLLAGTLASLGRRGSIVGTQSVIAFVVFGRFPEAVPAAFGLAGLVLLGGLTQTAFAALVARPPAWRRQRDAVAEAYRKLAGLAGALRTTSMPAASALDGAEALLSAPALLADRAVMALSALIEEGRRIRLELIALRSTLEAGGVTQVVALPDEARSALDRIAAVLELVAGVVAGGDQEPLERAAGELDAWVAARPPVEAGEDGSQLDARIAALAGQVLGAARTAAHARHGGGLRTGARPRRGTRPPFAGVREDLRRIRASATLDSAAGRHAVRLAVVVAGTELLTQRVALPRGYWAVVAAATVLRPEFGATFTRGAERVAGTCLGVVIATLIAVAIEPSGWTITIVVAVLAFGTYAVFPASFAAGTAGLTAVVVFLLHVVAPDSTTIALDRGIDALVGGAIGLTAYALWPTWSGASSGRLVAGVVEAQRDYLDAVLAALIGGRPLDDAELRPLARRARLNYSDAEVTVTLSQAEPVRGADPDRAAATLAGLRRLVYAVHALRLEARSVADREPAPALAPLAAAFNDALALVAGAIREDQDGRDDPDGRRAPAARPLPPLRHLYRTATGELSVAIAAAVRTPIDELIDATDTVAASLGLALP